MKLEARPMSVSDVPGIPQLPKLGFNHPSVVLTADVFQSFVRGSTLFRFVHVGGWIVDEYFINHVLH